MNSKKKILVLLNWSSPATLPILHGILRYSQTKEDWDVEIGYNLAPDETNPFDPSFCPDGLICGLHDDQANYSAITKCRARVFFVRRTNGEIIPNATSILNDEEAIGKTAAHYFIGKKFRNFAFVGATSCFPWTTGRHAGYVSVLKKKGFQSVDFIPKTRSETKIKTSKRRLLDWLSSLRIPSAVFCDCDHSAQQVLKAAAELHLNVPEQLSVLGVDNSMSICGFTNPPLSSILPDFESAGMTAAKELERIFRTKKNAKRVIRYSVKELVERQSTLDLKGERRIVEIAIDYIRRNAHASDMSVSDVAAATHCSIRHLEKCFMVTYGQTIVSTIRSIRIDLVKNILASTNLPMSEIHNRSGFTNQFHLMKTFKKETGMTLLSWKKKAIHHRR